MCDKIKARNLAMLKFLKEGKIYESKSGMISRALTLIEASSQGVFFEKLKENKLLDFSFSNLSKEEKVLVEDYFCTTFADKIFQEVFLHDNKVYDVFKFFN